MGWGGGEEIDIAVIFDFEAFFLAMLQAGASRIRTSTHVQWMAGASGSLLNGKGKDLSV